MKFIFLAPRFHTNQTSWVRSLIENGHEVTFNVLLQGNNEDYSLIKPKKFSPCLISKLIMRLFGDGGVNLVRGFPGPLNYFIYLKKSKPDFIIVRDIGRWFSFLGAICARFLGIRIIIYSQTHLHKHYSFLRKLAMDLILKIFQAKWMTPIYGDRSCSSNLPDNIFFVPFAVETPNVKKNKADKIIKILSIGKFEVRKNHLMLIRIIGELQKKFKNVLLTIVGEASNKNHLRNLKDCEDFIAANNLTSLVRIFTNIDNNKIKQFYFDNDIFILPATEEPAAISPLEAIGYGLPCICSNTNGTRFYIENNITGIIFSDNSYESLKNAVTRILDNKEIHRMQENITMDVKEKISKGNFYTFFVRMINER